MEIEKFDSNYRQRSTMDRNLSSKRMEHYTLTTISARSLFRFVLTSLCIISSVNAFTDDLDQLSSVLTSSSELNNDGEFETGLSIRSNLSCYVCTTIDDMRCKFINETNKHLYDLDDSETHLQLNHERMQLILNTYGGTGGIMPDRSIVSSHSSSNEMVDNTDPFFTVNNDYNAEQHGQQQHQPPTSQQHHIFGSECAADEQFCLVRRLGVSSLNSATQEYNFFAVQRSCAKHCNAGCFIIGNGERTKLSFCTTCCTSNYCNVGSGATPTTTIIRRTLWCPISNNVLMASIGLSTIIATFPVLL